MAIEIIKPKEPRGEGWVWAQVALLIAYFLVPRVPKYWNEPLILKGLGFLFMGWGAMLMAGGFRSLGRKNLTPCPKPLKTAPLVVEGAYRYCRHPMYLGGLLLAMGWPLHDNHLLRLAFVLVLAAFYDAKARREEKYLTEKFPDYPAYAAKVKRFIPGVY